MVAITVGGIVLGGACSDGESLGPPLPTGGQTSTPTGGNVDECNDGAERDCSVTIAEHNGVVTCMHGTQACEDGHWTACGGAAKRITTMPRPGGDADADAAEDNGLPRPRSLSMPGICVDNPCDPSCQEFEEDPGPEGVTIESDVPPFEWYSGDINGLDPEIAQQGTTEPCATAEDCQFDQYCDEPSPVGCAHHPCGTGTTGGATGSSTVGLFQECSPCVQKVCAEHPECCIQAYTGTCEHDQCVTGTALKPGCDTCTDSICNKTIAMGGYPGCCSYTCTTHAYCEGRFGVGSECSALTGKCSCSDAGTCGNQGHTCNSGVCNGNWTTQCTSRVAANCAPKTCATASIPKWTQACVNHAQNLCGFSCEPAAAGCVHNPCYTGDALNSSCPGVAAVCATTSSCCATAWTDDCVKQYQTLNNTQCPPKGSCTSYLPGEANAHCAGADLTLGVPCGGTVPVCNRGSTTLPVNTHIEIDSYPAGTNSYPSSGVTEVLAACTYPRGTLACSTNLSEPLPPGECINMAGCDAVPVGSELRVNAGNNVAECVCGNNWSVYQNEACTSPACVANANVSFIKKLTMFIAVDLSTSMACSGGNCPSHPSIDEYTCDSPAQKLSLQRWIPLRDAMKSFFQDPGSAGMDIALRFWPDPYPVACGANTCAQSGAGNGCAQPLHFGTLTAASGAADTHETNLVNAMNTKVPCGDTPIYNSLDGALYWATQHKLTHPDQEVAVVYISDGFATHCNTNWFDISQLSRDAFHNHGVRTYPIGFGAAQEAFVVQLAQFGGGRGFFFNTTGSALQSGLIAAMKSIRGDVQPCDVQVPVALQNNNDPTVTIDDLEVVYTHSNGTEEILPRRANLAACGGLPGWYPDNATDPTFAKLCPATCSVVQADLGARVQARLEGGCVASFQPTTYTQTYTADCPSGAKVQWGFLRWESTTPSDTRVDFTARTADTTAGLATATSHALGTASAALGTQSCTMTGPSPTCPVDLYTQLGELPDARKDILELTMALNPSGDLLTAPTVHSWEITYSCPYSE
ncbi:Hypothetical protein CAP_8238 [Chondromyces apiculatus DSM 436]|uniref:VWFA domain-containing protein n=2 Tax=Chondromyces apiculatus TaxID=51 RepID=A0A017TFM8_9BACT|nr:Hypothetical protein CAP_8238 [Chondromyces apiculatus DSM 436]